MAFHEVQPWSSSASLALNFPSDYDVLKSMLSHDMSQETNLPRSDSVHQFPLCFASGEFKEAFYNGFDNPVLKKNTFAGCIKCSKVKHHKIVRIIKTETYQRSHNRNSWILRKL